PERVHHVAGPLVRGLLEDQSGPPDRLDHPDRARSRGVVAAARPPRCGRPRTGACDQPGCGLPARGEPRPDRDCAAGVRFHGPGGAAAVPRTARRESRVPGDGDVPAPVHGPGRRADQHVRADRWPVHPAGSAGLIYAADDRHLHRGRALLPAPPLARRTEGTGMIQVTDLTKRYGETTVLDAVSLEIPRDGVTALVGPNGAGKSTLLSIVGRLLKPQGG